MITEIRNGKIISDGCVTVGKSLYIKDGKILSVTAEPIAADEIIDAEGSYVSPGFIDIHTHGAGGYDFTDGTPEDILAAALAHARHGTTTVYPTSPSVSHEELLSFIKNTEIAMRENRKGKPYIAGAHLEGPYFSLKQCGAQDPRYIKAPVPTEYREAVELADGVVKRISFAPELLGSAELCDYLNERGIVSAFAHTDGVYEELKPVIDRGCRLATHLYSGMNTVTRRGLFRKLGAVETAYLEDTVTVEVIADGIHLPRELLRLIYKIKGSDAICLVTDSMRGAGEPEGLSVLGPKSNGTPCIIKDGVAYLTDMTSFAGSVATADRLVRVMHKDVGLPIEEAVKMITETPARIMGLADRGRLREGFVADVVIFDEDINIERVIVGGVGLMM